LQGLLPRGVVHPNDDFLSTPEFDYEGFRAALREDWGSFSPALEADIFASKVRARRVFGFVATDLTCNATRVERTEGHSPRRPVDDNARVRADLGQVERPYEAT
jgi:hypothetical protein